MAIAGVPVKVIRAENNGTVNPGGFAIAIEDADGAEMRPVGDHKYGSHLSAPAEGKSKFS